MDAKNSKYNKKRKFNFFCIFQELIKRMHTEQNKCNGKKPNKTGRYAEDIKRPKRIYNIQRRMTAGHQEERREQHDDKKYGRFYFAFFPEANKGVSGQTYEGDDADIRSIFPKNAPVKF